MNSLSSSDRVPPSERRPAIALAPGGPKTEFEEFREPLNRTVPADCLGESAKGDKLNTKIDAYISRYLEHSGKKESRGEAIKGATTKLLLLAIVTAVAIATAPFTFGGSLVIGGILFGGIAAGAIGLVGGMAYLGVTEHHAMQMKEVMEKLKKAGVDEKAINELVKLKQDIQELSADAKESQKNIKGLSNKVKKFVTKMSLSELNALGIDIERLKEISVQSKIHRLSQDPKKNEMEIAKLGLLLANARETPAAKNRQNGEEFEIVENYEIFRASERPDDIVPITGTELRDPVLHQRRILQIHQNELTEDIINEERRLDKLEKKIDVAQKAFNEKKEKLIANILASQVTKFYIGFGQFQKLHESLGNVLGALK